MLHIETHGTWREMGRQIGEEFREHFAPVLDHFAAWLRDDLDAYRPAAGAIRALVLEHCPELQEETLGMAEAVGFEPDLMLGLRFFNELRHYRTGCSGAFISDAAEGPLLVRTCDIEPDIGARIQLCRVNRPADGPHTITCTYLGMTGGVGFNEHGLAVTGSSAPADVPPATEGVPMAIGNFLLMNRCRSLDEATGLLSRLTMRGKAAVLLICDETGSSALVELASGHAPVIMPREEARSWQACSNFCPSGRIPNRDDPRVMENAYTRYGRMVHLLDGGLAERSVEGMKNLIADIVQPGPVCHAPQCWFKTAYAFVAEVRSRRMHLCPGHPAEVSYTEVSL